MLDEDIKAGLSVTEVSHLSGLARMTLHKWLRGRERPVFAMTVLRFAAPANYRLGKRSDQWR